MTHTLQHKSENVGGTGNERSLLLAVREKTIRRKRMRKTAEIGRKNGEEEKE